MAGTLSCTISVVTAGTPIAASFSANGQLDAATWSQLYAVPAALSAVGALSAPLVRQAALAAALSANGVLSAPVTPRMALAAPLSAAGTLSATVSKLVTPPVIVGAPGIANAANVALPAHSPGMLLIIFALADGSNTLATKPAASGTVPAWIDVPNCAVTGSNGISLRAVYFVATASNHTSGNWTGATVLTAVAISGQGATIFGGTAESGATAAGAAIAPAVTMSKTDGSSLLLHGLGHRSGLNFTAWDPAPTGYTQQTARVFAGGTGFCLDTKDDSTSDGAVTQTTNGTVNNGYYGATIEVLS